MLIRKIKCANCGGNKVNEIKTGFLYCDYCSSFMGYDFEKVSSESMDVFTSGKPEVQEYMAVLQKLGQALGSQNEQDYIDAAVKQQEFEMILFPARFSPRAKLKKYRDDFLNYYRHFLQDRMADNFFEDQKKIQERFTGLMASIKTKTVNYRPYWEYDENLEKYFDEVKKLCMEMAEKTINYPSAALYPEPTGEGITDMIFKQSLNAYTTLLDEEAFVKVVDYLGVKTEYIEIPQVSTTSINCFGCGADLSVPDGSEKLVCEYCGNTNLAKTPGIVCLNCSGNITPEKKAEGNACPWCGAILKAIY